MKKLNLAVIGQGRSGKDIHGKYYRSEHNEYFNVKYVVDADEYRRGVAIRTHLHNQHYRWKYSLQKEQ